MTRTSAALVAIEDLLPSPGNIRSRLTNLEPLAASIRSVGVLQTLLVVPAGPSKPGKFRVIEGHRRRAASKMVGLTHVPCMVRHENKTDETGLMTIANLQREGLDPIDAARAFSDLRERHTIAEVAQMTGFSAATINARIGLLLLPPDAQQMVSDNILSLGDAANLVRSLKQKKTGSARVGSKRRSVSHFRDKHPLAAHVQTRCTHQESNRRLLGPGCEECWEATIRADALGNLANVTVLPTSQTSGHDGSPGEAETRAFDESAVERAISGDHAGLDLAIGEREEIVRRLARRGMSDAEIAEKAMTTGRTVLRTRERLGLAPAIAPPRPASA